MKPPSPLLGFNNNVRHKGRVFHIQTEDSGVRHPHIITHLFADGGRILKTTKTSYAEFIDAANMGEVVRQMMQDQHKAMFMALRDGQFDHLVDEILSRSSQVAPAARPSSTGEPKSTRDVRSALAAEARQLPGEARPSAAGEARPVPDAKGSSPGEARPAPIADARGASPGETRPAALGDARPPVADARPGQPGDARPPIADARPPIADARAPLAEARTSPIADARAAAPREVRVAGEPPPPPLVNPLASAPTMPSVPVVGAPQRPVPSVATEAAPPSVRMPAAPPIVVPASPAAAAAPPPSPPPPRPPRSPLPPPGPSSFVMRPTPARVASARPRLDIDPAAIHRAPEPNSPAHSGTLASVVEATVEAAPGIDLDTLERAAAEAETPLFQQIRDLPPPPAAVIGSGSRPPASPGSYSSVAAPLPPPASTPPPSRGRYAPSRPSSIFASTRPQEGASIFGEDLISEKSLDEVILSYLAEDLDGPGEKK